MARSHSWHRSTPLSYAFTFMPTHTLSHLFTCTHLHFEEPCGFAWTEDKWCHTWLRVQDMRHSRLCMPSSNYGSFSLDCEWWAHSNLRGALIKIHLSLKGDLMSHCSQQEHFLPCLTQNANCSLQTNSTYVYASK